MSMQTFVKRWFGASNKPRPKFRPKFDALEERACPAVLVDVYDQIPLGNSPTSAVNLGTASQSQSLSFAQSGLTIDGPNDEDFFKFKIAGTPGAGDQINIYFTHADGDLDMRLFSLAADGSTNQVDFSLSTDDNESISLAGKAAGDYVLRVNGHQDSVNNYTLTVFSNPTGAVTPTNSFPTLNDVSNSGIIDNLRPQLSWTPAAGALAYQIWIDDLTTGASNIIPNALSLPTSFAPEVDLVSGHTYRFWVRGLPFGGPPNAWSFAKDFTVSTVQITPINGEIHDLKPYIAWTGVTGAKTYKVWVNNLTTGQTNIFPTSFGSADGWQGPFTPLAPGHQYKIWVQALNEKGEGVWSPGTIFQVGTISFAKPLTAVPTTTPSLPFTPITDSHKAIIQLDNLTTGQTNLFPNQELTGQAWSPPSALTVGHSYRIWAKVFATQADFNAGVGTWGQGTDFTINTTISPLTGPATTLRPTLFWSKIPGVASYDVYLSDQANGVNLVPGFMTPNGSFTPNFDLISGHTYDMWVRPQGTTWSAKMTFKVDKVTEIKLNKDGANNRRISWTPLSAVTNYELWVDDLTSGVSNLFPGLSINQPNVVTNLSAHWILPASMDITHTYRIWIKARNAGGLGEWSTPYDFTPNMV